MLSALHIINIVWKFKKIENMLEILPSYISYAFIYFNIFTHFLAIIFHNLYLIIYGRQCRKFLFSNLLEDHPHKLIICLIPYFLHGYVHVVTY